MKSSFRNPSRGSGIGLVMILILALSIVILSTSSYVNVASKAERHAEAELLASRAAEAALEINMARIFAKANEIRPGVPTIQDVTAVCNLSTAPTGLFSADQGYQFTRNIAVPVEDGVPVSSFTDLSDATKTYRYISEATVTYTNPGNKALYSTVTMQRSFTHQVIPLFQYAIFFGGTQQNTASNNRGNGILELNPGQNFTVGGRVHSNRSLYYGSNSTLTYQGIVTSVEVAKNERCPNDPRTGYYGNDAVFANGTPAVRPYKVDFIPFPCSTRVAGNVNQEGPIEFIQMPDNSNADPNEDDREYNMAGLKILVNSGTSPVTVNGITIRPRSADEAGKCWGSTVASQTAHPATDSCGFVLLTFDGTKIPERKASATGTYNTLYQLFDATIAKDSQPVAARPYWPSSTVRPILRIYSDNATTAEQENCQVKDFRQDYTSGGRMMRCVSVDVSKLARVVDVALPVDGGPGIVLPSGSITKLDAKVPNESDYGTAADKALWNGIVYIKDVANSAAENTKGIMLENGQTLPVTEHPIYARGGGLTFVTEHSAYIIGNYNTGGNPPVNTGAATDAPTVAGYTVRPAAVMADAITVLSSNWTTAANKTAAGNPSARPPKSTTFNVALLSGNVPSSRATGFYSGGVENFLRLLEDWYGERLTYNGSMICLFPSLYATSPWRGDYYGVPSRNWHFEKTYNNPNKLPPGTPNAIVFSQGEWVRF